MTEEPSALYSLVMIGFQGKYRIFQEEAEKQFGRRGLSAFCLRSGQGCLPAEIACGLSKAEADRISEALTETGATLYVVPAAKVEGVRYRASDCWPNRIVGDWRFTEVDGMILTLSPLNARRNVQRLQERDAAALPWQLERSLNHQHPTHAYSRRALRVAREMGEDLTAALRIAYPARGFVLDYLDNMMSFYQRGGSAPEHDEPPREPLPIKAPCETCGGQEAYHLERHRAYRLRERSDEEFPKADWGECANCGAEMLIRNWEIRVIV